MTELQRAADDIKKGLQAFCSAVENLEKQEEKVEKSLTHKWKHGDVFENRYGNSMICIEDMCNGQKTQIKVFCVTGPGCDCTHSSAVFLEKAEFLFNIKEKL